jgi:hypothetical protein
MHHGRVLQNRPLGAKTLHNCVLHVAFSLGTWQDCTINAFQEVGGTGTGTCGMDCCCCLSRMEWIGRQASVSGLPLASWFLCTYVYLLLHSESRDAQALCMAGQYATRTLGHCPVTVEN